MATKTRNEYFPDFSHHPGVTLCEKLKEICVSPKEFSEQCAVSLKTITDVLNGNISITPEMAALFENKLKIPAHFWMNKQRLHDEAKVRARQKAVNSASTDIKIDTDKIA